MPQPQSHPSATLTEADSDRTIEIAVGEVIELCLHENASTGYRWAFDRLNRQVIHASEGELIRQPAAVGNAGDVRFLLTAVQPTTTEIRLKLWRHWEGNRSIQKRVTFKVAIKP